MKLVKPMNTLFQERLFNILIIKNKRISFNVFNSNDDVVVHQFFSLRQFFHYLSEDLNQPTTRLIITIGRSC